jgi:sulfate adenylyltransferase (ADP) / ATP adenylyltransferase
VISASGVAAATERGLASGALQPIHTESAVIEDGGIQFIVRVASSLSAKAAAAKAPPRADPLGDYEPELYVADVPPAHYLLLNKYNVVANHLLLVTRRFEPQERLLNAMDFAALAVLLGELDWLAFYNGGTGAGASEPRKHLQLVPLPLAPEIEHALPIEPLLGALPFRHAFAPLGGPAKMQAVYRRLLADCGISGVGDEERQTAPYNLLATRRWMLVVPRSHEHYESISVNALGFAGSLFVRNRAELGLVRRAGPMNVLRAVAIE